MMSFSNWASLKKYENGPHLFDASWWGSFLFYFHSDRSDELYAYHFLKQIIVVPKNR